MKVHKIIGRSSEPSIARPRERSVGPKTADSIAYDAVGLKGEGLPHL